VLRIGIDARFLTHPSLGGYQTYVQELAAAFDRIRPAHEIWLVLAADGRPVMPIAHLSRLVQPVRVPFVGVAWREQWSLPRVAAAARFDVMHYPTNTMPGRPRVPSVATVHDTMALDDRQPARGLRQRLIRRYEGVGVRLALRHARMVITVSDQVARDVVRAGFPSSRVRTVASAVGAGFSRPDPDAVRRFRARHGLGRPYLLALASADPRKNVETAIAALAAASKRHPELTLAILLTSEALGQQLRRAAAAHGLAGKVGFMPRLEAEEMPLLYGGAAATLFLSLEEGFGLPPLESMACGTPVICSNRPPMDRLFGSAALLVDPTDTSGVSAAIDRVLDEPGLRESLIDRGLAKAAEYSWDRAAAETIRVYEEAAG
jgi:glycosyltransferase involved in cell wall biosynthesis